MILGCKGFKRKVRRAMAEQMVHNMRDCRVGRNDCEFDRLLVNEMINLGLALTSALGRSQHRGRYR
jgi:hypothetical protein